MKLKDFGKKNKEIKTSKTEQKINKEEKPIINGIPKIKRLYIEPKRYKYFWLMGIDDVDLSNHCLKGLNGHRYKKIKNNSIVIEDFDLKDETDEPYQAYYLCGVNHKNEWEKNFHIAFTFQEGIDILTYQFGVELYISNAREMCIDSSALIPNSPNIKDSFFHTCRNWRFAHHFLKEFKPDKYKLLCEKYNPENKGYVGYDETMNPRDFPKPKVKQSCSLSDFR